MLFVLVLELFNSQQSSKSIISCLPKASCPEPKLDGGKDEGKGWVEGVESRVLGSVNSRSLSRWLFLWESILKYWR